MESIRQLPQGRRLVDGKICTKQRRYLTGSRDTLALWCQSAAAATKPTSVARPLESGTSGTGSSRALESPSQPLVLTTLVVASHRRAPIPKARCNTRPTTVLLLLLLLPLPRWALRLERLSSSPLMPLPVATTPPPFPLPSRAHVFTSKTRCNAHEAQRNRKERERESDKAVGKERQQSKPYTHTQQRARNHLQPVHSRGRSTHSLGPSCRPSIRFHEQSHNTVGPALTLSAEPGHSDSIGSPDRDCTARIGA